MLPSMQILFVHGTIVRVCGFEVPPPGVGEKTVMVRVPVDVTSVPGIVALSLVELRKVVVLSDPFNRTTELATKFVPSTVSENPPLPTVTVSGAMEVVVGTGFAG